MHYMMNKMSIIKKEIKRLYNSKLFVISIFCIFASIQNINADTINILTGELPPYSYSENGEQYGLGSAIVKEICNRTGAACHIETLPWSRSVVLSQKQENSIIYPLGRTKEREEKYLWIGPILKDRLVFAVRKSDERTFNSLDDLKDLKIGVILNAPPQKRLQNMKFSQIDTVIDESINGKKLLKGRIDAWYAAELIMMDAIKKGGLNQDEFKIGFVDMDLVFYIGTSKNMTDIAIKWQEVLEGIKSDGTYDKIIGNNK
ncbi:putative Family 3 extracellular solute-binding protein [Desulfamplus magnetovallimortis]|uniref:Putative Family 3 extracellular solute-binding protein n=1 Tax=Desulfamplus magnetovallimortis TaxID=1246637 RepID=A0A1W1HJ91_9BACT|nr:transporter substrate-binding domain-containing protein [Desulfamplus magnetovallimortis]SLM32587.1 putative Family 3 extracellular solute-binding protein [Desulfamplus magnetovallimortis]